MHSFWIIWNALSCGRCLVACSAERGGSLPLCSAADPRRRYRSPELRSSPRFTGVLLCHRSNAGYSLASLRQRCEMLDIDWKMFNCRECCCRASLIKYINVFVPSLLLHEIKCSCCFVPGTDQRICGIVPRFCIAAFIFSSSVPRLICSRSSVCAGVSLVPSSGDILLILSFSKLCMFFLYPLTLTVFFTFLLYVVLSLFDISLGYHWMIIPSLRISL